MHGRMLRVSPNIAINCSGLWMPMLFASDSVVRLYASTVPVGSETSNGSPSRSAREK
jgi:hypothetical protein